MRGLSQAECCIAGAPGFAKQGAQVSCVLPEQAHGLATTEKEVNVVLERNRVIVVAQEGG